jgi:aromatic aminotransferase
LLHPSFTLIAAVGFLLTRAEVELAAALTAAAGAWLVFDNTYEHFVYGLAAQHVTLSAPNVVNIFSFSKAYGMMGWRVGYIAVPDDSVAPGLMAEMLKVQDTIPICAAQVSQVLALEALREGRGWVQERVAGLQGASRTETVKRELPPSYRRATTHLTALLWPLTGGG